MSPLSSFPTAQAALPARKKRKTSPDSPQPCSGPGRLFACPFQKKYPDDSDLGPTCSKKGWPTFHRLKEHLKRTHASREFRAKYMPDLADDDEPVFSLNEEAERILCRRSKRVDDSEKWCNLFRALFSFDSIPTPYVEQDVVDDALNALIQFSQEPGRISNLSAGDGVLKEVFVDMLQKLVNDFRCERSRGSSTTTEESAFDEFSCQSMIPIPQWSEPNYTPDPWRHHVIPGPVYSYGAPSLMFDQTLTSEPNRVSTEPHFYQAFEEARIGEEWIEEYRLEKERLKEASFEKEGIGEEKLEKTRLEQARLEEAGFEKEGIGEEWFEKARIGEKWFEKAGIGEKRPEDSTHEEDIALLEA